MIRTLLVDDDSLTLELHRSFLARVSGFTLAGECTSARAARTAVLERPGAQAFDLVLLDITMPDGSGVEVLRTIRARTTALDVIAITGVRDAGTVQEMAALGVFQYLVKPFPFAVFSERLTAYREYRQRALMTRGEATQSEIDALLNRARTSIPLPKGLSAETLERVCAVVRSSGPLSSSEAAVLLGMSRVAVRRYLEHLADDGLAARRPRYGSRGRPETEYHWSLRPSG